MYWFVSSLFNLETLYLVRILLNAKKLYYYVTAHSHSVVPGGFGVKSYKTLEIPSTLLISCHIFSTTSDGRSLLGIAGVPVMKSLVMKGLSTTERWHDGFLFKGPRSK